jgi:hypothetical protein
MLIGNGQIVTQLFILRDCAQLILWDIPMRKWWRDIDEERFSLSVSVVIALLGFSAFVVLWTVSYERGECLRDCATDFSARRR